jgi:chromosome partitioning protein
MRNAITVMNAKGGVGKSTLVVGLAETLANYFQKTVLIIDADAQASVSHMLVRQPALDAVQSGGRTVVDYLIGAVLKESATSWREFVTPDVSDIDDARSIALMASDTNLTLFEREVSKGNHEAALRKAIGGFLVEARQCYDIVLIDSAPGLSVLTECFLREADFYLTPVKPDYISIRGLKFLQEFRQRDPHMGFAESLGIIINMKDLHSPHDEHFDRWLRQDPEHRCFQRSIPRVTALQSSSFIAPQPRSYWAKYPGETGGYLRQLTEELLGRLAPAQNSAGVATAMILADTPTQGYHRAEQKTRARWKARSPQL